MVNSVIIPVDGPTETFVQSRLS